jgi:hypothetical protein
VSSGFSVVATQIQSAGKGAPERTTGERVAYLRHQFSHQPSFGKVSNESEAESKAETLVGHAHKFEWIRRSHLRSFELP